MHRSIQGTLTRPQNSSRFASDWISAQFWLDHSTKTLAITADDQQWTLEAEEPELLAKALDHFPGQVGEFNAKLKVLLIPGAHQIVGTSFFRLRNP